MQTISEVVEGLKAHIGKCRLSELGVNVSPRSAPKESGAHTRLSTWQDVIVEAVSDVENRAGLDTCFFDDPLKEV
jgi:hypothetical protein